MKQQTKKLSPLSIMLRFIRTRREKRDLNQLRSIPCNATALSRSIDQTKLQQFFLSQDMESEWLEVDREISSLRITEKAGGITAGDRRALYYLLRYLRPRAVLEIGTYIGASTVHIIAALRQGRLEDQAHAGKLVTVDICDVNEAHLQPWLRWGATYSPRDMAAKMGAADWVRFIINLSMEYFSRCTEGYDCIFLDGDHAAQTVYQEIPAALKLLNPEGVILLHDYYPNRRPLWSNGTLTPGPWLATQRLKAEGARFRILPLGELPCKTKLNSKVTSLALLVGE